MQHEVAALTGEIVALRPEDAVVEADFLVGDIEAGGMTVGRRLIGVSRAFSGGETGRAASALIDDASVGLMRSLG